MSYIQLIHEYLDQGLNETQESALFAELARDNQLRSEFQFQLKLQKLAQVDMMNVAPPIAATSAIFSNLGFTIPTNDSTIIAKKEDNRKYILLLALFFALTATSAVYYLWNMKSEEKFVNSNVLSTLAINQENGSNGTNESTKALPIVNQSEEHIQKLPKTSKLFNKNSSKNQSENLAVKNVNNIKNDADNLKIANAEAIENIPFQQELTSQIQASLGSIANTNNIELSLENPKIENTVQKNDVISELNKNINPSDNHFREVMIEVKGISTKMNESNLQGLQNTDMIKNWSIAGFYRLNKYHSFAVEFGNEQFVIRNRLDANTKAVIWLGPAYRFTASDLFVENSVDPFIQLSLAATTGVIAKANIGLMFSPNSPFSGNIAYELATLIRGSSSADQYYKKGITLGFSYKFSFDK